MVEMTVWVAPIAAVCGTALGAWLVDHFSGKRWQSQQQWAIKEKRYTDLLTQLMQAQMSLQRQSEYYDEPGSEHQDCSKVRGLPSWGGRPSTPSMRSKHSPDPVGYFYRRSRLRRLIR
jgi:hypothetical protein